jgi:hypothetical protein
MNDYFLEADWICGHPERMRGRDLAVVRKSLDRDRHSLAVEVQTTERLIAEAESMIGFIPEKLDIAVRELFLGYKLPISQESVSANQG